MISICETCLAMDANEVPLVTVAMPLTALDSLCIFRTILPNSHCHPKYYYSKIAILATQLFTSNSGIRMIPAPGRYTRISASLYETASQIILARKQCPCQCFEFGTFGVGRGEADAT